MEYIGIDEVPIELKRHLEAEYSRPDMWGMAFVSCLKDGNKYTVLSNAYKLNEMFGTRNGVCMITQTSDMTKGNPTIRDVLIDSQTIERTAEMLKDLERKEVLEYA